MKIGIRIDWMNMRVEFSPNVSVLNNLKSGTGVTLQLGFKPADRRKYSSFVAETSSVETEEVFDDDQDTLWWVNLMDETPEGGSARPSQSPVPASAPSPAPSPTPAAPARPAPAPPAPLPPAPAAPKPLPPAPLPPADAEPPVDVNALKKQLLSIQTLVGNLQQQFASGHIDQQTFLEKQNFLGAKMGEIMAKLDSLGVPY